VLPSKTQRDTNERKLTCDTGNQITERYVRRRIKRALQSAASKLQKIYGRSR